MLKVLIAVDGSATSRSALTFVRDLLEAREASVILFSVIPQQHTYGFTGPAPEDVFERREARGAVEALLDEYAGVLREFGVGREIEKRVVVGDPAELILTAATDATVDLIVVGSRGLNTAQRFLLGSVSSRVVAHAACPVLVVHPRETD